MVEFSLCISMALICSSASPVNIGGQGIPETCIRAGISTNALHVCSIPHFSHEDLRDVASSIGMRKTLVSMNDNGGTTEAR